MNENTFGRFDCQKQVTELLVELNDNQITRKVSRIINYFYLDIKELRSQDFTISLRKRLLVLLRNHYLERWKEMSVAIASRYGAQNHKINLLYSVMINVIITIYREELRKCN